MYRFLQVSIANVRGALTTPNEGLVVVGVPVLVCDNHTR